MGYPGRSLALPWGFLFTRARDVQTGCRHHLSRVHPYRAGVQSEPGCSSPFYLPTCRLCNTRVLLSKAQESRQGRRALHASTPQIFSPARSARFCAQEPGLARLTPAAPGPTLCREPSRGGRRSSRPKRSRFRSPAVVRSRPQPPRSYLRCRSGPTVGRHAERDALLVRLMRRLD